MKSAFKFMCMILTAIIMLVSFEVLAAEPQVGAMPHTNADDTIGCDGGDQDSGKRIDKGSDSDKDEQGAESKDGNSGGNSGSGGGGASGRCRAYSIKQAVEYFNVQDYTIEDGEKYEMHGCETALRRDRAIGDAWIVFEMPYVSEFDARSLHLPADVAPMKFELSKDGKSWTAAEIQVTESPEDGRWTEITYSAKQISGMRYVKAIWGEENNLQNWWNPYFIGITAAFENPIDYEIVIDTDENIAIPRYDSREYTLSGRVLDQIGAERESKILWRKVSDDSGDSGNTGDSEGSDNTENSGTSDDSDDSGNPSEIEINSDGAFTVSADMLPGTKFKVRAQCGQLVAEKTFVLCAALPGDTDGDNIITQTDIDFILENYGKAADMENRLCDVDKDGKIDIVDLSYAARYLNIDFNKIQASRLNDSES